MTCRTKHAPMDDVITLPRQVGYQGIISQGRTATSEPLGKSCFVLKFLTYKLGHFFYRSDKRVQAIPKRIRDMVKALHEMDKKVSFSHAVQCRRQSFFIQGHGGPPVWAQLMAQEACSVSDQGIGRGSSS